MRRTTKPGARAPGVCLLSRGAFPGGQGAAARGWCWLQPDHPIRRSLVVGRSCRRWHLGPGVEWDVPWGPGHLRPGREAGCERCSGRRVSPPGKVTPGTSVIRREVLEQGPDRQRAPGCCSGGVSSIDGASESRCSHDGPGGGFQQRLAPFRHWSSWRATGLHEGGFMAPRGAAGKMSRARRLARPSCSRLGASAEPDRAMFSAKGMIRSPRRTQPTHQPTPAPGAFCQPVLACRLQPGPAST